MGRGWKGLIEQSQKKPKNPMKMNKQVNYWCNFMKIQTKIQCFVKRLS